MHGTSIILLLLASIGGPYSRHHAHTTQIDKIELNHLSNGETKYDQVIFWKWSPDYKRFDSLGYVMVNEDGPWPVKEPGGLWVFRFRTYLGTNCTVKARLFVESFTQDDPEKLNKKLLETKDRPPLFP